MPSEITAKQLRLFFGPGSPLTQEEKDKLRREIREGKVKIKGAKR